MDRAKKKATGFYPTPKSLVSRLVTDHVKQRKNLPTTMLETSAGQGDFILETWNVFIEEMNLDKRQIEKMVSTTILIENDRLIFNQLKKNVDKWCSEVGVRTRPQIHCDNFLLNGQNLLKDCGEDLLVVGNPPWDEFTTRKHDGEAANSRSERMQEKIKYQSLGFKNVYQSFLHEVLTIDAKHLSLIFVLPRQLLGDLSAQDLRKNLVNSGSLKLTVYCNKDEPSFYFEAVARTAEILCVEYVRSNKKTVKIRRGFDSSFKQTIPYGSDYTIPCSFGKDLDKILERVLDSSPLSGWDFSMEVKVARGKVDYTDSNYKKAANGRTISAYQFEEGKSTDVILNKILPDSKRKLKAAILKTKDAISDSMLRINCKNQEAHPYLMLALNSRPVELALRSVISNINLNNFRLMSLPIPEPTERTLAKAKKLCKMSIKGEISWEHASDELAKDIYKLSKEEFDSLKESFPDRNLEKLAA